MWGRGPVAVVDIYRYFSGNYHFLGSFSEWYGTRKSGMVTLVLGFTSSGQRWFAERHGVTASRQVLGGHGHVPTRFLPRVTENESSVP